MSLSILFLLHLQQYMSGQLKTLAVIIPALNEEKTLGGVIQRIPKQFDGISQTHIVVVNDGSTDRTAEIAREHGAQVVTHLEPMGVGAAFYDGIKAALHTGADIIVNIDADGQFDPEKISILIEPISKGSAGMVTASRFKDPNLSPEMPSMKKWGNRQVAHIVNFITNRKFSDVSCGFRAYSREAALRLTLFGHFTYTQETFIDLVFKGVEIVEIPMIIRGEREHGKSRVASNLWRYALKSATIMFRAGRDYKPFYFIGIPGIAVLVIGALAGLFLLYHYITTGQTSPYRSLVPGAGILIVIGTLLLFISLIADMIHRNRVLIEELLYHSRQDHYRKPNDTTKEV